MAGRAITMRAERGSVSDEGRAAGPDRVGQAFASLFSATAALTGAALTAKTVSRAAGSEARDRLFFASSGRKNRRQVLREVL